MSKSKWRVLILTSLITIAPILYGASVYNQLPARLVTHWGVNNAPNGWMAKPIAVFGIPLLMLLFHLITVGTSYYAANKQPQSLDRMNRVTAWIFPVVTVVFYTITIRAGLGDKVNIRFWSMLIIAVILILIGNYLPTVPNTANSRAFGVHFPWQVRNQNGVPKTMRIMAYTYVLSGAVLLLSLFFPAVVSAALIALFIVANIILMVFSYLWTTR